MPTVDQSQGELEIGKASGSVGDALGQERKESVKLQRGGASDVAAADTSGGVVSLTMNFYWLDGIFQNKRYGCQ